MIFQESTVQLVFCKLATCFNNLLQYKLLYELMICDCDCNDLSTTTMQWFINIINRITVKGAYRLARGRQCRSLRRGRWLSRWWRPSSKRSRWWPPDRSDLRERRRAPCQPTAATWGAEGAWPGEWGGSWPSGLWLWTWRWPNRRCLAANHSAGMTSLRTGRRSQFSA